MFQLLLEAGRDREIVLKIAQNNPSRSSPNIDTQILAKKANAQVTFLQYRHFDEVDTQICHSCNFTVNFFQ